MSGLSLLAVVFVAYALVASKLDRWWITAPMVFVLAGVVVGPAGLDILPVSLENETTLTITELTLGLLLFADASTVRLRDVEGDAVLPNRLLLSDSRSPSSRGSHLGVLLYPGIGWAAAALMATMLAPTDAALGLAVVTNRSVPVRIRRALNVESGLNDGLATPFVTLFIAMVAAEEVSNQGWGIEALTQIGLALIAASVVGLVGGRLLAFASGRGWTSGVSEMLAVLALALLSYTGAVAIGGNGFVAAFAGGLLFGAATRGQLEHSVEFTETLGLFASFFVWAVFGALFVGDLFTEGISVTPIAYAVLSLTVVRMVPVAIALVGTRLRGGTIAFMGWFGPRGLASIVFTLIALEELHESGAMAPLLEVATWTIFLSVILHGVSATPLAIRYGSAIAKVGGKPPESESAQEPKVRLHDLAARHP